MEREAQNAEECQTRSAAKLEKLEFDMQKYLSYTGVFVTLVLVQIFLLDNIALSVYFHPLVYVAFIILLPLDTRPVWVMLLAALTGLTVDVLTGMGGLNVIAATAAGFLRPAVVNITCGRSAGPDESVPALHRLTTKNLAMYMTGMIALHSVIFFGMESLSLRHLLRMLLRLIVSDAASAVFIWYFIKLYTEKILNK